MTSFTRLGCALLPTLIQMISAGWWIKLWYQKTKNSSEKKFNRNFSEHQKRTFRVFPWNVSPSPGFLFKFIPPLAHFGVILRVLSSSATMDVDWSERRSQGISPDLQLHSHAAGHWFGRRTQESWRRTDDSRNFLPLSFPSHISS